jgi:hypothetical protein
MLKKMAIDDSCGEQARQSPSPGAAGHGGSLQRLPPVDLLTSRLYFQFGLPNFSPRGSHRDVVQLAWAFDTQVIIPDL